MTGVEQAVDGAALQVVLNARTRVRHEGDPDRAFARHYISEFRQVTTIGRAIESAGVYHDTHQPDDGRWRFARRYDRICHRAARDFEVLAFPADLSLADGFASGG